MELLATRWLYNLPTIITTKRMVVPTKQMVVPNKNRW